MASEAVSEQGPDMQEMTEVTEEVMGYLRERVQPNEAVAVLASSLGQLCAQTGINLHDAVELVYRSFGTTHQHSHGQN